MHCRVGITSRWEVQDIKGLSDKECEDAYARDSYCELLLYNSDRNDIDYMDVIQGQLHWFFTQEDN